MNKSIYVKEGLGYSQVVSMQLFKDEELALLFAGIWAALLLGFACWKLYQITKNMA